MSCKRQASPFCETQCAIDSHHRRSRRHRNDHWARISALWLAIGLVATVGVAIPRFAAAGLFRPRERRAEPHTIQIAAAPSPRVLDHAAVMSQIWCMRAMDSYLRHKLVTHLPKHPVLERAAVGFPIPHLDWVTEKVISSAAGWTNPHEAEFEAPATGTPPRLHVDLPDLATALRIDVEGSHSEAKAKLCYRDDGSLHLTYTQESRMRWRAVEDCREVPSAMPSDIATWVEHEGRRPRLIADLVRWIGTPAHYVFNLVLHANPNANPESPISRRGILTASGWVEAREANFDTFTDEVWFPQPEPRDVPGAITPMQVDAPILQRAIMDYVRATIADGSQR